MVKDAEADDRMIDVLEPINYRRRQREQLHSQLDSIRNKISEIRKEIDDFDNFDAEKSRSEIYSHESAKNDSSLLIVKAQAALAHELAEEKKYKAKIVSRFNVFSYMGTEQTTFRAHLKKLEDNIEHLKRVIEKHKLLIASSDRAISQIGAVIEKNTRFQRDASAIVLNKISKEYEEISKLIKEIENDLDLFDEKFGDQISEYQKYVRDIDALKQKISTANDLNDRLKSAFDGRERGPIHGECERLFGIGSPGKVIFEAVGELKKLENNLPKIEKRLRDGLRRVGVKISHIIIDGNNTCYAENEFIRLFALTHIVDELVRNYKVTVVFDATIRRLMRCDDNTIRQIIGSAVSIYISPTKTSADEYILQMGEGQETTFVLTNDQYKEFHDYDIVQSGRLIKFMITHDKVIIPDIDVVIPLPIRAA